MFCISVSQASCQSKSQFSWNLLSDESKITYVSVKNNNLMENNTFEILKGVVTVNGNAEFLIDLSSVNTNNDIRDERLRKIFFKTETYPFAKVTALINLSEYETLPVGSSLSKDVNFNLFFHGLNIDYESKLEIFRLGKNKVLVKSIEPIIIDGEDYGLYSEFKKLQQLAGLDSIVPVVPVVISLVFQR